MGDIAVFRIQTPEKRRRNLQFGGGATTQKAQFDIDFADEEKLNAYVYQVDDEGNLNWIGTLDDNEDSYQGEYDSGNNLIVTVYSKSDKTVFSVSVLPYVNRAPMIIGTVIILLLIAICICGCCIGCYVGYRLYYHYKNKREEEEDKQEKKKGWNFQLTSQIPELNDPFRDLGKQHYAALNKVNKNAGDHSTD